MQQILNFFIRNKAFFLFLFLFAIAFIFTIQYHSYHRSRFVNSANFVSGGIFKATNSVNSYFNLKAQNLVLQTENSRLKRAIFNENETLKDTVRKTNFGEEVYTLIPAIVYKNDYTKKNNVLLINKGIKDSVTQDLGVISDKGIVGITDNSSRKFTTVLSILNSNVLISAKLKKTNHFGTISWDTKSPNTVSLTEIPKVAPLAIGDTILTSGRSAIFPKDILIGTVKEFEIDEAGNFYKLKINLSNDMTSLNHVYIIKNTDKKEIDELLNTVDE